MLDEFSIPTHLVDRRVTSMRILSPSNLAVDFGHSLRPGTKCFGEGIYFTAKSGRICGEAFTRIWNNNSKDVVIKEDLKK
ncbi:putative geranylgeranyl diphosphate reductase, chloroplastic [Cocos nucifera]|uniref:Putative geranylgeranyl diphosphate reductase, chloroplastic n=1 Tax=Cocos nucifera TaxID=13894 RepID=A0A8K0N5R6_COCNU|nr:putative geranylgeranyl diphosphate reductase, chloroplastic [Cocos nucifera]